MVLFIDHSGPLVEYSEGMLRIEDLNPEVKTRWVMTRWQMVVFAFRAFAAAVTTKR